MSSLPGVGIILDLAMSLICKNEQSLPDSQKEMLYEIINRYIRGEIQYNLAKAQYQAISPIITPIQTIKDIIEAQPFKGEVKNLDEVGDRRKLHWSKAEDTRLMAAILRYGTEDWANIVDYVGNGRTRPQCLQRWTRTLNPKINKESWTHMEEQSLLNIVNTVGENCWTKVSHLLGTRSDVQCRYHYELMKRRISIIQTTSIPIRTNYFPTVVMGNCSNEVPMNKYTLEVDDFLKLFNNRKPV